MLLQHFAALLLANLFRNHPENRKYMTYHYASEEDRATAIGNTRNNTFGEDRTCSSDDMIADRQTQTDRQTDRHACHNTPLPYSGVVLKKKWEDA